MKIREAKKLLKQYPPIVEVFVSNRMDTAEFMDSFSRSAKRSMPEGTLIYVIPVDQDRPILNISSINGYDTEEFKRLWEDWSYKPMIIDSIQPSFGELSYINIHTVLKDGEYVYRKTKERLNRLVKEFR